MKKQLVLVEDPHERSQAALVLLCKKYMELEIDEWLSFRDEYLDEAKPWECTYCHRTDMIRIYDTVRAPANLVTLDHITPLSKGGDRYDPENICISCRKCNENKADKEE